MPKVGFLGAIFAERDNAKRVEMGMKKILLASAAIAVLASPALAADRNGWYMGLGGGYSFVEADLRAAGATRPIDFDGGWGVHGAVGKAFANHWRIEAEVGYRENDASFTRLAPALVSNTANVSQLTGMINVAYDLPLAPKWALTLGAGAGIDRASLDVTANGDDRDYVFAYQGILEMVYHSSAHWDVYFGYRYLNADNAEYEGFKVFNPPAANQQNLNVDFDKHMITLGIRYGYEEPAAPVVAPPPPPPPPPAIKQFIVFFGFNKYNLTAEAQAVVAEAASAAKSQGSASILVTGHTDTVGGNAYNQRLSEKRAGAVKDELVRLGIDAGKISAMGKGETELLVQTGDGVKEPQNRRATIDLK
jgi:outer membrane protein OmpA-like peptidoglycan-associated protein